MPNLATSAALVDTATKCRATAAGILQGGESPIAGGARVGHGLQRRECLRGDDEQRFRGIEVAGGLEKVRAVDIGDEAEGQVALAVMPQRLVCHDRPQVGPADADVDDGADRLPGVALPLPAAHPVGEVGHLAQHRVDPGHDVVAVDDDGLALRGAQSHVQDGPLLGNVDLLPSEHGIDAGLQAGFLGQPQQERERLIGDAVLRVVEVDADGFCGHPLSALGVVVQRVHGETTSRTFEKWTSRVFQIVRSVRNGTACFIFPSCTHAALHRCHRILAASRGTAAPMWEGTRRSV